MMQEKYNYIVYTQKHNAFAETNNHRFLKISIDKQS